MAEQSKLQRVLDRHTKAIECYDTLMQMKYDEAREVEITGRSGVESTSYFDKIARLMSDKEDMQAKKTAHEAARKKIHAELKAKKSEAGARRSSETVEVVDLPEEQPPMTASGIKRERSPSPATHVPTLRSTVQQTAPQMHIPFFAGPEAEVVQTSEKRKKWIDPKDWRDAPVLDESTHPTIILPPDSRSWVELRCHFCGGNRSRKSDKLYCGSKPFLAHFRVLHLPMLMRQSSHTATEKMTVESFIKSCYYKQLTAEEVNDIRSGDPDAYQIEPVPVCRRGRLSKLDQLALVQGPVSAPHSGNNGLSQGEDIDGEQEYESESADLTLYEPDYEGEYLDRVAPRLLEGSTPPRTRSKAVRRSGRTTRHDDEVHVHSRSLRSTREEREREREHEDPTLTTPDEIDQMLQDQARELRPRIARTEDLTAEDLRANGARFQRSKTATARKSAPSTGPFF